MLPMYEERASDSPYIEKVGRFHIDHGYSHSCPASLCWNILLVKYLGKTSISVWGPETQAAVMAYPDDTEFLFIRFRLGGFMPRLPFSGLANTGMILPDATSQSFWLDSSAWEYPDYENADTFVEWLERDGLLVHEPVVDAVINDHPQFEIAPRTVRHRFLRATGLTHSTVRQIERAQQAAALLEKGVSILDVVDQAGYADQPHLTRSLRRYIGHTPGEIVQMRQPELA
jgi:AraC-like DNA-binding protein